MSIRNDKKDINAKNTTEQCMNYTHCYAHLVHFFKNVLMYLNIHDWEIEFNGDNYCWRHKKTITINPNYSGDVRQIILHEIAHIGIARFSNQKHSPQFWRHLECLTKRFLKKDLDKYQVEHKRFMGIGIYRLCYEK